MGGPPTYRSSGSPSAPGPYDPLMALRRFPEMLESWSEPRHLTLGMLALFLLGMALSRMRRQSGRLWLPIGVHAGFVFAIAQYTYTRHLHRNYWQGKAAALAVTVLAILALYYGYMAALDIWGGSANLQAMMTITVLGVSIGQYVSYRILTAEPFSPGTGRYAAVTITTLVAMFSLLTFFPPRVFLFENLFCYAYTGEYGILDDYEPYRIFTRGDDPSSANINYCANADQDSS